MNALYRYDSRDEIQRRRRKDDNCHPSEACVKSVIVRRAPKSLFWSREEDVDERTQPESGKTSSELFVRSGMLATQVRPPLVPLITAVSQKQNTQT